jgi:hypothetical protein
MFLKERRTNELVEVTNTTQLFDPFEESIVGRYSTGEELSESQTFEKIDLVFCSNEPLPRCWLDPDYRTEEVRRTGTRG